MQQPFRQSLTVLAVSILAGCAAYQREPLDADRELGVLRERNLEHFVVERARPGHNSDAPHVAFDPSDGLDEAEVVAVALTLNPELRAKRAEVGEAQAGLIAAGLWPNPEVGVGPRWGIDGTSGWRVEADALFHLLRPGEREARRQAADARVDEVGAEVVAEEFKLVAEVRQRRLAVLAADRTVALLNEAVDLRQRAADLTSRQRQIGEGTELEVAATELETAQARRDLRKAQADLHAEQRELNGLMGLPPDYGLKLSGLGEPLVVTVFQDVADDELDGRLLAGRLELQAKEAEYRRAEQELRLAILQQYPGIGIGPSFERELEGNQSLGLALSLELPLFNQNQGEIAEKRAARERTHAEYTALLHRLRAQAFAARAAVRMAKAEVEVQERDILPLLRRNQELFEGAYRAREINVIDWITAQQRALDARREHLDALVRYRRAVIQLEAATGRSLLSPATATAPSIQPN